MLTVRLTSSLGIQALVGRQATVATQASDYKCGALMCVSARIYGSTAEYVLSSTGKRPVGWMAMGFGQQMANSPMVIMWANDDGTVTLSQRTAAYEVMPTVDPDPPRVASFSKTLTSTSGSTVSFGYTIPANHDTRQSVIFAYGTEVPSSSAPDADLVKHVDFGVVQLNLATTFSTSTSFPSLPFPTSPGRPSHVRLDDLPLPRYQRFIVVHAFFCTLGFLVVLPVGSLLARYLRTFSSTWFRGHWMLQFVIAGPPIVTGFVFGVLSVTKAGAQHLSDKHKQLGVILFILYLVQCSLGATIHWIKPKDHKGRPPKNYAHVTLGLLIVALALYQVHSGYSSEWPKATGREPVLYGNVIFYGWAVLLPTLYITGLVFLPKQFRQENQRRKNEVLNDDEMPLNSNMTDGRYRDSDYNETLEMK